jgi:hypothetical protein
MTQIKFYRVETLPETGEVGSLYFVYGSGGVQSMLYICVGSGLFELYTPDFYELENKLDSLEDSVSEVETKIDEQVAKQGENQEATNSKILEEVAKIPNLKNIYSARFEKNDDNINTYTMILPIVAGVEGDTIIL